MDCPFCHGVLYKAEHIEAPYFSTNPDDPKLKACPDGGRSMECPECGKEVLLIPEGTGFVVSPNQLKDRSLFPLGNGQA
jgi:hypothetical protein